MSDLKIVKLDLVGFWDWNLEINECIICKTDLQDPFSGEIEVGNCGACHKNCISR